MNFIATYPNTKCVSGVRARVKNHYRAHQLSLWLRLVPELHRAGALSANSKHNQFPDHDSAEMYEGVVRADPLHSTRPADQRSASTTASSGDPAPTTTSSPPTTCHPTSVESLQNPPSLGNVTEHWEITGYGAYSTALTVTIAIGCSLLVLNILIFAKVYRKKDRSKGGDMKLPFDDNKLIPSASVIVDLERENVLMSGTSSQHSLQKLCHHFSPNTQHSPHHHLHNCVSKPPPDKVLNPPNGSVHQYMTLTRSPPENQHLMSNHLHNTLPSTGSFNVPSAAISEMRV